ncbi:MAG: ribbon-helix-helix domain-containing protein [Cyanophyceae cyanobacterium]
MSALKISVSLPSELVHFIEQYKDSQGYTSRSQVIENAVKLLREQELENAYRAANQEVDPEWENVIGDGLSDETW